MKLAIVVNDIARSLEHDTTTCLGRAAANRGHEVWYAGIADLASDPDDRVRARARTHASGRFLDERAFLDSIYGGRVERVTLDAFDAVLLRNSPGEEVGRRPWARFAGITFGHLVARRGTVVLNDPTGLSRAVDKSYLQFFPDSVRPRALVSHDLTEIRRFARAEDAPVVLKPLGGAGGHNVFLLRPEDEANLNQMIEAVLEEGFAVAQEYLPAAAEGSVRLFLVGGRPLCRDGQYAAVHRARMPGELRPSPGVPARVKPVEVTPAMLALADQVRPRLVADGIFLACLDIAGDKLLEIDVFSPGGLYGASRLTGVDFAEVVVEALEREVARRRVGI